MAHQLRELSEPSQWEVFTVQMGHAVSLFVSRRIISGGRYGEVRVWSLEAALEDTEDTEEMRASRELRLHDRSTAVGQVKLLRAQAGIMCADSGVNGYHPYITSAQRGVGLRK